MLNGYDKCPICGLSNWLCTCSLKTVDKPKSDHMSYAEEQRYYGFEVHDRHEDSYGNND